MENVKNLVGKKFLPCFKAWLRTLEELGYDNYWKVLNAKDFGIPQNRERVFVVSIRKDLNRTYLFPEPVPLKTRLKDLLEPEVEESFYLPKEKVEALKIKEKNVSNAVRCGGGGSLDGKHTWDVVIGASRGRNPENPSSREAGLPTEQRIEANSSGVSNTLTTVQKDNLVLIKANTKKGYDIAEEGDSINLEQPNSTARRGRIGKGKAQTLTTSCNQGIVENMRIRKLTPRECWRLMGVKDEQFGRLHGISKTQLYKMAGNSIVVDVLMAIFKNLLISDKETKGQLSLF